MPDLSSLEAIRVRGLIINAPGEVSWEHFDVKPTVDDFVRVRVEACGLCTWEQRVYRGTKKTYPFWGGHEVCGIVTDINGQNTRGIKIGDRVALALMRRCGQCYYCKLGLDNHCSYVNPVEPVGVPQGPRGLSDHILVPNYQAFPLSPQVSFSTGTMVEPTACVLRSIGNGGVRPGNTVVVIGAGTMGLIHTILLKQLGSNVVICDDELDQQQALAAGAEIAIHSQDVERFVLNRTARHGADTVFCTRGGTTSIGLAVRCVRRGGRVVLYQSIPDVDRMILSVNDIHYREIQIVGTISQSLSDFGEAIDLISANAELLSALTIEVIGHEQCNLAFERAVNHRVNRILVDFDGHRN